MAYGDITFGTPTTYRNETSNAATTCKISNNYFTIVSQGTGGAKLYVADYSNLSPSFSGSSFLIESTSGVTNSTPVNAFPLDANNILVSTDYEVLTVTIKDKTNVHKNGENSGINATYTGVAVPFNAQYAVSITGNSTQTLARGYNTKKGIWSGVNNIGLSFEGTFERDDSTKRKVSNFGHTASPYKYDEIFELHATTSTSQLHAQTIYRLQPVTAGASGIYFGTALAVENSVAVMADKYACAKIDKDTFAVVYVTGVSPYNIYVNTVTVNNHVLTVNTKLLLATTTDTSPWIDIAPGSNPGDFLVYYRATTINGGAQHFQQAYKNGTNVSLRTLYSNNYTGYVGLGTIGLIGTTSTRDTYSFTYQATNNWGLCGLIGVEISKVGIPVTTEPAYSALGFENYGTYQEVVDNDFILNYEKRISLPYALNSAINTVSLGTNRFAFINSSAYYKNNVSVTVGNIGTDNKITYGPDYIYTAPDYSTSYGKLHNPTLISTDKIVFYNYSSTLTNHVITIATFSGDTVTFGTYYDITSLNITSNTCNFVKLDTDKFLLVGDTKAQVFTVSGTTISAVGSPMNLSRTANATGSKSNELIELEPGKYFNIWKYGTVQGTYYSACNVFTVVNDIISINGTVKNVSTANATVQCAKIDSTHVLIVYGTNGTTSWSYCVATISGTSVTLGSSTVLTLTGISTTQANWNSISLVKITDTNFVFSYADANSSPVYKLLVYNKGANTAAITTVLNSTSTVSTLYDTSSVKVDYNKFVSVYSDSQNNIASSKLLTIKGPVPTFTDAASNLVGYSNNGNYIQVIYADASFVSDVLLNTSADDKVIYITDASSVSDVFLNTSADDKIVEKTDASSVSDVFLNTSADDKIVEKTDTSFVSDILVNTENGWKLIQKTDVSSVSDVFFNHVVTPFETDTSFVSDILVNTENGWKIIQKTDASNVSDVFMNDGNNWKAKIVTDASEVKNIFINESYVISTIYTDPSFVSEVLINTESGWIIIEKTDATDVSNVFLNEGNNWIQKIITDSSTVMNVFFNEENEWKIPSLTDKAFVNNIFVNENYTVIPYETEPAFVSNIFYNQIIIETWYGKTTTNYSKPNTENSNYSEPTISLEYYSKTV